MRTTHVGVFQGKTGLCRRRQVLVVEAMLQDGFQAAERECVDVDGPLARRLQAVLAVSLR
jgi:hypothetical protein